MGKWEYKFMPLHVYVCVQMHAYTYSEPKLD